MADLQRKQQTAIIINAPLQRRTWCTAVLLAVGNNVLEVKLDVWCVVCSFYTTSGCLFPAG